LAYLIILLGSTVSPAVATEPCISIDVTPVDIRIGDQVEVQFTVTSLQASKINVGKFPEAFSDIQILSSEDFDEINLLGARVFKRTVRFVPFAVEDISLPQLDVEVITDDGSSFKTATPPLTISVASVAGEEGPQEFIGLKDIESVPEETSPVLWIVVSVILVLIALAAALYFLRKRLPSSVERLVKLTPAQRALQDLDALMNSGMLQSGRFKQFFTELANIIRRYLGLRYHVTALEMTSTELYREMERTWRDETSRLDNLSGLLGTCDLVKFARFTPPEDEGVNGVKTAAEIVEITRDDIEPHGDEDTEEEGG
jgi:hypothetical protein